MADLFNTNGNKQIETQFRSEAKIVLHPGDAAELLATLPDASISLIITSPPYNLGKDYEIIHQILRLARAYPFAAGLYG